jgi:hypothetical protein
VKWKKREEMSGGGDSGESDLGAKRRMKRKIKGQNGRKRATRPRFDHLRSRSPSHRCGGGPRNPEQEKRMVR